MNIAVLYADIADDAGQDELDVLVQVKAVSNTLLRLQHSPVLVPVTLDLADLVQKLRQIQPDLVFNLVESLGGSGRLLHLVPTLLDFLKIPYTGCSAEAEYITTNKLMSKERLRAAAIPTPQWYPPNSGPIAFAPPYIIKPIGEDASIGLTDAAVVHQRETLMALVHEHTEKYGPCFVEAFIPGREFNISILGGKDKPEVLPAAEIRFVDYPSEKPQIVGYEAKWDIASYAYQNTVRHFDFPETDNLLLRQLQETALRCWDLFGLRGYARVDFRIDQQGQPWVLEVNANPCISPDAGFIAAAEAVGYNYDQVIERIIADTIPAI